MIQRNRILTGVSVFLAIVNVQAIAAPPTPRAQERVVYGMVCHVTLHALPPGLRESMQSYEDAICRANSADAPDQTRKVADAKTLTPTITTSVDALVEAFESADRRTVFEESAAILQYATRVAMLPNHDDEASTDNTRSLSASWAGAIYTNRVRLRDEARVSPVRFRPVNEIEAAVQAVRRRGFDASDRAFGPPPAADSNGITLKNENSQSLRNGTARVEPNENNVGILEDRIEDAALLAARLIGTAWINAGKPTIAVLATTRVPKPHSAEPRTPTDDSEKYVASRHSNIFHKLNCPHAKRIKPANRVIFSSRARAKAANKKPCRTCHPDRTVD